MHYSMPNTIPMPIPPVMSAPMDVDNYLLMNGWRKHFNNNGEPYYQDVNNGNTGYFTWNEALAYHAFKKTTMGAFENK